MLSFIDYLIKEEYLEERYLSIGFNKDHEQHREKHRSEIHDILHKAYSHPDIGVMAASNLVLKKNQMLFTTTSLIQTSKQ